MTAMAMHLAPPMHSTLRLSLALAASLFVSHLRAAVTYVGNLDGSHMSSTFTTSTDGFQALGPFGWTSFSGAGGNVYGQTGGTTNDVLIGVDDYDNYGVQFNTGVGVQANQVYSLSLLMGYVSGGTSTGASYDISLGTWNGSSFTAFTADTPALEVGSVHRNSGPTQAASFGANIAGAVSVTVTYTTGASPGTDPIRVRWAQTAAGTVGPPPSDFFGIDNVTLSVSAIPEPSTYAAVLGCLVMAAGFVRRRRSSARLN
jgi:hypothetical protein